jgi:excisionase family DNA binding protein
MPKITPAPVLSPSAVKPLAVSRIDAAKALSVDIQTIDGLIASKRLKASKIGRRVLIRVAALEALLDANPVPS